MKKLLGSVIDSKKEKLIAMADQIFDWAEISGQEFQSSRLLTDCLKEEGFTIEYGTGLETAFRATYENMSGGPVIGILVEYDALEGIGHACGHHLQGPSGIGAALAIKECIRDIPYKLVVYGTPAEETLGGKIVMLDAGYMKELDLALMSHASPTTCVDEKCMALENFVVTFHGIKSHAGGPLNVVPDTTVAEYTLRSYSTKDLDGIVERFLNIIKGAALMTSTTYDIQRDLPFKSKVVSYQTNKLLMDNAVYENAPCITEPRKKPGSTDFGNVLYEVPGSCIRIAFVDRNAAAHSEEYLKAGKSRQAHESILYAAKIMADTIADVLMNPEYLEAIKEEFRQQKGN